MIDENGHIKSYYTKVNKSAIELAKEKLKKLFEEALDNHIIDKEHFTAMNPADKGAAKFYMTFKVHKEHDPGTAPPERPICSGSGTMLENTCKLIEHYIKEAGTLHETYLQDTPDFLRHIEEINKTGNLEKSLLVTMDVIGLFTNIPKEDGIEAVRNTLEAKQEPEINTEFILRILTLVLENNIMEFDSEYYKQEIGAPMGQGQVPPYANIFMSDKIDPRIVEIAKRYTKHGMSPLQFLKRFLDDLFSIWNGTSQELHNFFNEINKIHPNMKFTMKHTTNILEAAEDKCDCTENKSISFLDTSLSIKDDKISVDLYRKPSDRNQYLLTNSIHPPDCIKNIPYSLALRITRTCTETEDRELRYSELKNMLLERKYKPSLVDAAVRRARAIPRVQALKRVVPPPTSSKRPVFAVTYDPRLPDLQSMQRKHWRSMVQDSYLKSVFPEPPLVAFRRQKNISDFLIRARLPPKQGPHPKRTLNGMKKCNKQCLICPFVKVSKQC
jgi:hypothetical protein